MTSMRGTNPELLVGVIVDILDGQVMPAVKDDEARATLHLLVGLLANLGSRVEQRSASTRAEGRGVQSLLNDLDRSSRTELELGGMKSAWESTGQPTLAVLLRQMRRHRGSIDDDTLDLWLASCRRVLSDLSKDEVALMRPTRYLKSQG